MNPRFSLYLDGMRAVAALVVLLSHWAYGRFTGGTYGIIRDLNLGSDAVVIFFVLSGFVIGFTAQTKDKTLGAFLFARATRIYSVAIPAILLTILLDRIGVMFRAAAYDGFWYHHTGILETITLGLSFANEWTVSATRLGSNGPWWSLSYEVAYYLLFAAAFYLKGGMRYLVPLFLGLLFGLNILLLLPTWLMGLMLWRFIARNPTSLSPSVAWGCAIVPAVIYGLALAYGLPDILRTSTGDALGISPAQLSATLRFSDEVIWNSCLGLLTSIHLLGIHGLSQRKAATPQSTRLCASIRWLAGGSFSLYLVHYPVLQFLDAMLDDTVPPLVWDWLLLTLTVFACLMFAQAFERPLKPIRAWVLAAAVKKDPLKPA